MHTILNEQQRANTRESHGTRIPLTSGLARLYPFIGRRQASLPQDLNQIVDDDFGSDDEDPVRRVQSQPTNMGTPTDTLCDVISSFDPSMTPEEFRYHFLVNPPPVLRPSHGGSHVPGSLPATIYHIAHRDDGFRQRLQQTVSHDARASQYFEKQYGRARTSLRQVSRYIDMISREQQPDQSDDISDIPTCARTLRSIVHQMCSSRDTRTSFAPLSIEILRRLAEILVRLIAQVMTLDSNVPPQRGQDPRDEYPQMRNLFLYLIGDPPNDPTLPPWITDAFVIDRLRGYPSSEWSHLLELLTTIKDGIEEKDLEALPSAFEYAAKIDDMLRDYTATANEPSSSSAQMPRRR